MTLAFEFKCGSVINSSWKFDLFLSPDIFYPLPLTVTAGSTNNLTSPLTSLALHPHHHNSLLKGHKASSLTSVTFLRFRTGFGLRSLTSSTNTSSIVLYGLVYKNYTLDVPLTASLKSSSILTAIV